MILYGFFHCGCIYESGHSLVSLHQTKRGAYRAMVAAQWEEWEKSRDDKFVNGVRGLSRQLYFDYLDQRRFEAFKVMPVEVLP